MRRVMPPLSVALALLCIPQTAAADAAGPMQLPDDAALTAAASPEFLNALVMASVAGMNCPNYNLTDQEWALLSATASRVAAALNIGRGTFDEDYYGRTYASLDQPGACERETPKIAPLIKKLKQMGASTG